MQQSLFDCVIPGAAQSPEIVINELGKVSLYRQFLSPALADSYFSQLHAELAWQQSPIRIAGRQLHIPRLNAWYGDRGCNYGYSGIALFPLSWTLGLMEIKTELERFLHLQGQGRVSFNSVLANLYRNERDSVAWHADDEPELGPEPLIASISLGVARRFSFKPKRPRAGQARAAINLDLPHGSLLLMQGATQSHWQHQLPKSTKALGPRINLTFRQILGRN